MNKLPAILLLTMPLLLGTCVQPTPALGQLDQVILLDVQGLWGGQDLWIASDNKAVCRFVTPPKEGQSGLQEVRYTFMLSAQQQTSLLELLNKHSFLSLTTKDRYGVPDEARPSIFMKSGTRTHAVGKWANDNHEDFDSIYQALQHLAESGKKGTQTYRGPFDWNWSPDGFPKNKTIQDMTRPKIEEK